MLSKNLHSLPRDQRGAALITGLLIMIVMTLIGLSAMDSSLIQTKLATNTQLNAIGFQTTEAALAQADNNGTLLADAINDPMNTNTSQIQSSASLDGQGQGQGQGINVNTTIRVNACGELPGAQCLGLGLNANASANNITSMCFAYTLAATTTIGTNNASLTRHTQSNSRTIPGQPGMDTCDTI